MYCCITVAPRADYAGQVAATGPSFDTNVVETRPALQQPGSPGKLNRTVIFQLNTARASQNCGKYELCRPRGVLPVGLAVPTVCGCSGT